MIARTQFMKPWRALAAALALASATVAAAQHLPAGQTAPGDQLAAESATIGVAVPTDYVIGRDDLLSIVFWREREMSAEVVVRPDGMISLPLLDDVAAAGLTPGQLRDRLTELAGRYVDQPHATVLVRQINSRKVFITGHVQKPGSYPLNTPTTVLQLIATAGGLAEFANAKKITIIRTEGGTNRSFRFNYDDVVNLRNLGQNIALQPGDAVIVP